MLNFSSALWPLFSAIVGGGVALTIALCWLAAIARPPHGRSQAERRDQLLPFGHASRDTARRAA